jgi:spore germination protein YaaH
VLVIPPKAPGQDEAPFTHNIVNYLGASVDYYSLMTYDHSNAGSPGPNAPIDWVRLMRLIILMSEHLTEVL